MYRMEIRGKLYDVNAKGEIRNVIYPYMQKPYSFFSKEWRVYGVAKRYNSTPELWESVKEEIDSVGRVEGYLYSVDHGTISMWSGRYCNHIPKVLIWKTGGKK